MREEEEREGEVGRKRERERGSCKFSFKNPST